MNSNHIIEIKPISETKTFLPSVGALAAEEFKPDFERDCEDRGAWLKTFCPEDRCLQEEERIKLVAFCEEPAETRDPWLYLFCPRGSCEIFEPSQLS